MIVTERHLVYNFPAMKEETMFNHTLDKHTPSESDNRYFCDECDFRSENKAQLGRHFRETHMNSNKLPVNQM